MSNPIQANPDASQNLDNVGESNSYTAKQELFFREQGYNDLINFERFDCQISPISDEFMKFGPQDQHESSPAFPAGGCQFKHHNFDSPESWIVEFQVADDPNYNTDSRQLLRDGFEEDPVQNMNSSSEMQPEPSSVTTKASKDPELIVPSNDSTAPSSLNHTLLAGTVQEERAAVEHDDPYVNGISDPSGLFENPATLSFENVLKMQHYAKITSQNHSKASSVSSEAENLLLQDGGKKWKIYHIIKEQRKIVKHDHKVEERKSKPSSKNWPMSILKRILNAIVACENKEELDQTYYLTNLSKDNSIDELKEAAEKLQSTFKKGCSGYPDVKESLSSVSETIQKAIFEAMQMLLDKNAKGIFNKFEFVQNFRTAYLKNTVEKLLCPYFGQNLRKKYLEESVKILLDDEEPKSVVRNFVEKFLEKNIQKVGEFSKKKLFLEKDIKKLKKRLEDSIQRKKNIIRDDLERIKNGEEIPRGRKPNNK